MPNRNDFSRIIPVSETTHHPFGKKEGMVMPEEERKTAADTPSGRDPKDHPWLEMPMDESSLDEALRYTLDEIRF